MVVIEKGSGCLLFQSNIEKVRFEQDKAEHGCVVRSLESAFGVRATDEEYIKRLDRIARNRIYRYSSKEEKYSVVVQGVRDYINEVSSTDTDLGQALQTVNVREMRLTSVQIKERLDAGDKLCVVCNFAGENWLHMGHVVKSESGILISASDKPEAGKQVVIGSTPGGTYHAFVFIPKNGTVPQNQMR